MKYFIMQLVLLCGFFGTKPICGQSLIQGKILDEETGKGLMGAVVGINSSGDGAVTNFDGLFSLQTVVPFPFVLNISYSSYDSMHINVSDQKFITLILHRSKKFDQVIVESTYLTEEEKKSPLSRNQYNTQKIALNPAPDLFSGIATEKDIDGPMGSIAMRTINTRGFNSVAPVRMLQIIDGADNQSPGLNFSLGNFLGVSEMDLLKVDIIVGASTPYYGPNAFNGVISMETKDPFIYPGLSAMVRVGERNLLEAGLRFAAADTNKNGDEWMAYKLNFSALTVHDWEAQNYDPITDSKVPPNNPGRFDAVNIYGDEYKIEMDASLDEGNPYSSPGIGNYYRVGYKEKDVVDYDSRNYKANATLQFRLRPHLNLYSPEILLSSSFGAGNTIYQGDNRFSLRDIHFFQHKIEFRKRDVYFLRAYLTHEDAGNSYDPYFTALKLIQQGKIDNVWKIDYESNWNKVYYPKMCALGYPKYMPGPPGYFDFEAAEQWLVEHNDSMQVWHNLNANFANQVVLGNPPGTQGYLMPGTESFDNAFTEITSRLNNESGGTRFYDRSALIHFQGEYIFRPKILQEFTIGGNLRKYIPDSKGTIFYDTAGTSIRNMEFGIYAGIKKSFFKNKPLLVSTTLRADKNENFQVVPTYAAGIVYQPKINTFFRLSFSSALRNPTLSDQYLYLNVGPAILAGHVDPVDSLITPESFMEYRKNLDITKLVYFNLDRLRPEFVKTIEAGVRTTLFKKVYLDAGYYINAYRYFLGYVIGIRSEFQPPPLPLPLNTTVFRYTTNSTNQVITNGFSGSIDFQFNSQFTFRGNYSYNALQKTNQEDPIIPAYNTPKHKYNVGLIGQDLKIIHAGSFNQFGFMINYKWIQGFVFEGSPQFTGYIPSYGNVDAQINLNSEKVHTMIKIGASNLFDHRHYETYGGPTVGRMAYIQMVYQFNQ